MLQIHQNKESDFHCKSHMSKMVGDKNTSLNLKAIWELSMLVGMNKPSTSGRSNTSVFRPGEKLEPRISSSAPSSSSYRSSWIGHYMLYYIAKMNTPSCFKNVLSVCQQHSLWSSWLQPAENIIKLQHHKQTLVGKFTGKLEFGYSTAREKCSVVKTYG